MLQSYQNHLERSKIFVFEAVLSQICRNTCFLCPTFRPIPTFAQTATALVLTNPSFSVILIISHIQWAHPPSQFYRIKYNLRTIDIRPVGLILIFIKNLKFRRSSFALLDNRRNRNAGISFFPRKKDMCSQ